MGQKIKLFGKSVSVKWLVILFMLCVLGYILFWREEGDCGCCTISEHEMDETDGDGGHEGFSDIAGAALGHDIPNSATFSGNLGNGAPISYPDVPPTGDKLDMLTGQTFRPDCCPSTYSSSSGCACLSEQQMDFLSNRGGNR
jgi:hypothetical protein